MHCSSHPITTECGPTLLVRTCRAHPAIRSIARRHHTQRQVIADAKDAMASGLGRHLVRPFELWLELFNSAKVRTGVHNVDVTAGVVCWIVGWLWPC